MAGPRVAHRHLVAAENAVERGDEQDGSGLLQDRGQLAIQVRHEQSRIGQVHAFGGDERAQHRGNKRGADPVAHHVKNKYARFLVGDAHDMKKIAADQTGRLIKVSETQLRGLGCGVGGKDRVFLGQERLLQFHRHAQIGLHLLVPGPDLAFLRFELENVPAQERVLYFEEGLGGDKPDEIARVIDQQHIVVKLLLTARENRRQHRRNGVADRDADFVFAQMLADRIARPKREAEAPAEEGAELVPGTHPDKLVAFENSEEFDVGLGKGARDLFRLRACLRRRAVTNELREIDSFRLKNALTDVRRRRRDRRRRFTR